ncbi:hypothetical protein NDJ95_18240, partial [Klebsiella pneumoniae]|nr:hypothetical protein [Klebsiella pneumoniae]MCT9157315.1 hypothetical protein [Klebsiella pneumoniae]
VFAGKKSAQIREILISESAWEEMTCLFAPSVGSAETNQEMPPDSHCAYSRIFPTSSLPLVRNN